MASTAASRIEFLGLMLQCVRNKLVMLSETNSINLSTKKLRDKSGKDKDMKGGAEMAILPYHLQPNVTDSRSSFPFTSAACLSELSPLTSPIVGGELAKG
ncbi:hypothetical protein E2C01_010197 [Portunus trituberculatus]|uniref:Uncharacterized protein n=1 Tax=Portunus trituberculatus TaxID=210409 RepID=A0A5B7D7V3_PORTR|nr:hypothetical protein [Portunus trituberculatus]